ncbi:MAG: hypothetical protein Kow0081_2090 [Candidatus Dojkabacteria bacterium]
MITNKENRVNKLVFNIFGSIYKNKKVFGSKISDDTNAVQASYRKEVRAFLINKDNKFVVVNAKSYEKGAFSPPKGGLKQEESPLEGLKRELEEELGIVDFEIIQKSKLIQQMIYPPHIQEKSQQKGSVIYSFWIKTNEEIRMNEQELNEVKYLSSEDFKALMQQKLNEEEFDVFSRELRDIKY